MSCRKTVARWVEGVACHLAVGSRDLVGRRIPAFQARAFSKFPIAGPVLCWFVGCGSNEDIGLGGLAVYRIGVSKKSFLNNKLSGQPSFGNISITELVDSASHGKPVGQPRPRPRMSPMMCQVHRVSLADVSAKMNTLCLTVGITDI